MAKFQSVNTAFWNDRYIASLPTDFRYFFLYAKTNKHLNTGGFCKLHVDLMGVECGLDTGTIRSAIEKLQADEKLMYKDGWLALKSVDGQSDSPKIQQAVKSLLIDAPNWVSDFISKGVEKDERANHVAILAVRELLDKYPRKESWDLIIEQLGEDFDVSFLVECHAEWSRRGYNPNGMAWLTDWYVNRKIPYRKDRQTNTSKISEYRKAFSS